MSIASSKWPSLVVFILLVAAAALAGTQFKPGSWYAGLIKPAWTPPNSVFGPVWSVLYVMIALAGWLVWRNGERGLPLASWGVALVLNASWSWLFFGRQAIGLALVDIVALWCAILAFALAARAKQPWRKFDVRPVLALGELRDGPQSRDLARQCLTASADPRSPSPPRIAYVNDGGQGAKSTDQSPSSVAASPACRRRGFCRSDIAYVCSSARAARRSLAIPSKCRTGAVGRRRHRLHRLQRGKLSEPRGTVRASRRADRAEQHELCGLSRSRAIRVFGYGLAGLFGQPANCCARATGA